MVKKKCRILLENMECEILYLPIASHQLIDFIVSIQCIADPKIIGRPTEIKNTPRTPKTALPDAIAIPKTDLRYIV